MADFEIRQQAYNDQVLRYNRQGGAPAKDYVALNKEKQVLENLAVKLNNMKDDLILLNKQVNFYVPMLNTLVEKLNIKVSTYNNIGTANGDEFSEGEYVLDQAGQRITIYQFENNSQLVRVLTHELGHALGIEHVSDPKAIMYRLNVGGSNTLIPADMAELKLICGK